MLLVGVVVRRYIDFFILLIPTPLVSVLFAAASLFFHLKKCFSFFNTTTMQGIPLSFRPPTVHHRPWHSAAEVMTKYIPFCIEQLH